MKSIVVALSVAFALAFPVAVKAANTSAPLDEYFGRMHMSVLEITNRIHDAEAVASLRGRRLAERFEILSLTQSAIEDWAAKYPGDPWIPQREFALYHLFWAMHTTPAMAAGDRCRTLLFTRYANSTFAALARQDPLPQIGSIVRQ